MNTPVEMLRRERLSIFVIFIGLSLPFGGFLGSALAKEVSPTNEGDLTTNAASSDAAETSAEALSRATNGARNPSFDLNDGQFPAYNEGGELLLPSQYQRWPLVGSSLGLGYSERTSNRESFHRTHLEPASYDHFIRTGEFRDGTMLALIIESPQEGVPPQQQGRFASNVLAVEFAVKDSNKGPEEWAYYDFGAVEDFDAVESLRGPNGSFPEGRPSSRSFQADSCYSCHAEHAAHDNVFLQFYPRLAARAPAEARLQPTRVRLASSVSEEEGEEGEEESGDASSSQRLALRGFDPVLLTEGKEEKGKQDIVGTSGPYLYRFVSQANLERFLADPDRFEIQNDDCPIVPGAQVRPELFSVYENKIYAFASEGCIEEFVSNPGRYVGGEDEESSPSPSGTEGGAAGSRATP